MAQKLVVLALCLVAIVGLVSAASPVVDSAAGPAVNSGSDVVGNTDESPVSTEGDDVVAAPIGSEEASGPSSASIVPAPAPNAAAALQISTLAGVGAATVAGFFF